MIKGSCLCEGIRYEYDAPIAEVVICHCDMCKRAQGTAFATNAPIKAALFSITHGAELIKEYWSSANKKRVFCSNCGSALYSQRSDSPDIIRLRLGTVTEGHIPAPHYEIHCDSRSSWLSAGSDRPTYDQAK